MLRQISSHSKNLQKTCNTRNLSINISANQSGNQKSYQHDTERAQAALYIKNNLKRFLKYLCVVAAAVFIVNQFMIVSLWRDRKNFTG